MDQSLRTVATQLLNASNSENPSTVSDNSIKKPIASQKPSDKSNGSPMSEIPPSNVQSVPMGFGRPMNSKFSYFESSHPGQAMAMTEEELEREMSSTRLMTAYKNHPTTTGGISTWILLNPPSTTVKPAEVEKQTKHPSENEVRVPEKPTTVIMERVDTTEKVVEKTTVPIFTAVTIEEPSTTKKPVPVTTKKTTILKPEKVQSPQMEESVQNTTVKVPVTTLSNLETKEAVTSTVKKVQLLRTTPKPKIATTKTTVLSKPTGTKVNRPNQQNRPKQPNRRTTVKPDINKNDTSVGKIEKVTFRPVQMITTQKTKIESTEKPMFVTKIKASILMDTQKTSTSMPSANIDLTTTTKTTTPAVELVEVSVKPKPGTKVNNVLKVQLKKPIDEVPKPETEHVKLNTTVVKVEKVTTKEDNKKKTDNLDDTTIDLMKFDFNPELTKINTDTETSSSTLMTTTQAPTSTSTTKRPKRKKNKNRRRKPATPATSTTTVVPSTATSTETELILEDSDVENGIQESKIVPETKVATNLTKTKKKPPSSPISTQIYNFLSREVMPSFGVMSLVGLGLGLASYFLYPFGGTVARRNYEVEPKYKYNFDEYGGNYGQSEEEVLAKVLQGMTPEDKKYTGPKDYDNYYKYQHYDGGYETQTTKKNDQRNPSSSPIYRPDNSASILKYRNTDYRYSDPQSTPKYYERPKPSQYVVGQTIPDPANRQFVVGSASNKEYLSYDDKHSSLSTSGQLANGYEPTESSQVLFDHDLNQNFNFPVGSVKNYGQIQTARPEETYEEVEITPTAVAVEHGPRSLRVKRSLIDTLSSTVLRTKRDSVIQVIPSKRELEEDEKEDDLSNEILNIIDSALPGEDDKTLKKKKDSEVEDFDVQRRKQKEKEKTRLKESTTKSQSLESNTALNSDSSTISSAKETTTKKTSSSIMEEIGFNESTTTNTKTTEHGNVDWVDMTTKKPAEEQNGFNLFSFVKKIAEIKFRLGISLLKHASEGFARYLGHVQKRINGEE